MSTQNPTVAKYSITIGASQSVHETLENVGDSEIGKVFADALRDAECATRSQSVYVLPASVNLENDSYAPENDLPEINAYPSALAKLRDEGFLSSETLIWEDENTIYADDSRDVTTVTVHHAFKLVTVAYNYVPVGRPGLGREAVRDWKVEETSETVPAGVYLIGRSGNAYHMSDDITVYCGADADPERLFYAVAEDEEWGASRASAGCSADETHRWEAESGSWHFSGEYVDGTAPAFDFDDAEDFDDDTHACPVEGCTGRVGYTVY